MIDADEMKTIGLCSTRNGKPAGFQDVVLLLYVLVPVLHARTFAWIGKQMQRGGGRFKVCEDAVSKPVSWRLEKIIDCELQGGSRKQIAVWSTKFIIREVS